MIKEFFKHVGNIMWAMVILTGAIAWLTFMITLWVKMSWAIASFIWLL